MNRRVVHRYALWLLPLLAVRALIPIGFMLSVGSHGLELTFCPVQSSALVQALAKDGEPARHRHALEAINRGMRSIMQVDRKFRSPARMPWPPPLPSARFRRCLQSPSVL